VVGDFAGQQRLHHYLNDEPALATHMEARWRDVQLGFDFAITEEDDDA